MKSTPKLKEILADLGIEFDAAIGKEELRELVLQKDALTKWEEKHPDQKKVRAYCLATAWPPHVHVHVHPHTHCQDAHCHVHRRRPARLAPQAARNSLRQEFRQPPPGQRGSVPAGLTFVHSPVYD